MFSTLSQDLEFIQQDELDRPVYVAALNRIVENGFQGKDDLAILEVQVAPISDDALFAWLGSRDERAKSFGLKILKYYQALDNESSGNTPKKVSSKLIERCLKENPFKDKHAEKTTRQSNSDIAKDKNYQELLHTLIDSCEGRETSG